jgi:hypothetical protein
LIIKTQNNKYNIKLPEVEVESRNGYKGISSNNSPFMKNSRYVFANNLSKSLTIWPPYIISPNKYLKSAQGTFAGALSI